MCVNACRYKRLKGLVCLLLGEYINFLLTQISNTLLFTTYSFVCMSEFEKIDFVSTIIFFMFASFLLPRISFFYTPINFKIECVKNMFMHRELLYGKLIYANGTFVCVTVFEEMDLCLLLHFLYLLF